MSSILGARASRKFSEIIRGGRSARKETDFPTRSPEKQARPGVNP